VGLAFKISSVPFHQWAPDVYEGAPTTVTGFMATAVKVAAFGALLRVLVLALEPGSELIYRALWLLAVLSMTVGNVMAIVQQSTKRMLAYSSIAHAGYVLVGVVAGSGSGHAAVLFYLFAYTFMTIGAFAVVAVLARRGDERERIDDLAGLGTSSPLLAAVMALCMFSLAGIPGTAGFMGKYNLFLAAIERANAVGDSSLVWLAIIAVVNSAISLAYYLRIPVVMYMRDPAAAEAPDTPGSFEALVLVACAAIVLLAGIVPYDLFLYGEANLLDWALVAGTSLVP
jgi:NADH-quinone oxidoreductase subunit N